MILHLLMFVVTLMLSMRAMASTYDGRYGWPTLKAPRGVIVCEPATTFEESMLLESLSGLAAQAVNEGRFDEMVWINTDNISYKRIFEQSTKAIGVSRFKSFNVWELLTYLKKEKVVKGYVLYNKNLKKGNKDLDNSSNVATVYASLLSSALVEASLEERIKKSGLRMKKDARRESLKNCFDRNKNKLNNSSALCISPVVSNVRDYAIAHKLMLFDTDKALTEEVLEWVRPLSPILGWGIGDEYDATSIISEWGHYNTASDWCMNLPFISSVAPLIPIKKAKEIELGEINFSDTTYVHSFVMSDGDNMQWTMGAFNDNSAYAGHNRAKETGVSWSLCPTNLSIVSPVSWNELLYKQGLKNSFIEYGGGYQYPDLFAKKRSNRKELLREFAQRMNVHLKKMNITIFGAIFKNVESLEAKEALQIYAEELEDITGMIAIQYFPYELGKKVSWYKNRGGVEIPLITADFSLWNEVNAGRPLCGTPEFIASLINRELLAEQKANGYSWTIVHAWSNFAETSNITSKPAVGVNPIIATEKLLLKDIRVVSLNELLWRVRMKYKPEQTKKIRN